MHRHKKKQTSRGLGIAERRAQKKERRAGGEKPRKEGKEGAARSHEAERLTGCKRS
jgi:hypothetical protein